MDILLGITLLLVLGIFSQWLAWRLRIPSILLLLLSGFLIGPVLGWLNPDQLFGDLLFPIVALSVAVILFEGGLGLNLSELSHIGKVVRNLVTVGAFISWLLGALGAYYLLHLSLSLSVLLGAILVVTGPTVIGPLIRQLKPTGQISSILKWEGIMIDPIGAMLAVLVFQGILLGGFQQALTASLIGVAKTLFIGFTIGGIGALLMTFLLRHHLLPDFLQNPFSLMMVVLVYTVSNLLQDEAGLLAATMMGILLANQKVANVKKIVEFKENLRVLLISGLFLILAARVSFSQLAIINLGSICFLFFLILVVRPMSVWFSTIGSKLTGKERLFLSALAPRGIVAAAVASVFSFELAHAGIVNAELLMPLTFLVIIGTVLLYSLLSHPLGKHLKLIHPNPQGLLMVGASEWIRKLAYLMKKNNFEVQIIDTNYEHVAAARMNGITAFHGDALSSSAVDELDLQRVGYLLAMTPNDQVNALAVLRFTPILGSTHVFQLAPAQRKNNTKEEIQKKDHLEGRILFNSKAHYSKIEELVRQGAEFKKVKLTEKFDYDAFKKYYNNEVFPLLLISPQQEITLLTSEKEQTPKAGQTLISLVFSQKPDYSEAKT